MNLPTHWNPFRQVTRFDPLTDFGDLFRGIGMRPLAREYERALDMRMDVVEDDKTYKVTVDIPGVKKDHIDVSVEGNLITISAEVKQEQSSDEQKALYSERFTGKAYRSFTLPFEVDSGKSEAHYDGGVLSLILPKKMNGESKRLPIH